MDREREREADGEQEFGRKILGSYFESQLPEDVEADEVTNQFNGTLIKTSLRIVKGLARELSVAENARVSQQIYSTIIKYNCELGNMDIRTKARQLKSLKKLIEYPEIYITKSPHQVQENLLDTTFEPNVQYDWERRFFFRNQLQTGNIEQFDPLTRDRIRKENRKFVADSEKETSITPKTIEDIIAGKDIKLYKSLFELGVFETKHIKDILPNIGSKLKDLISKKIIATTKANKEKFEKLRKIKSEIVPIEQSNINAEKTEEEVKEEKIKHEKAIKQVGFKTGFQRLSDNLHSNLDQEVDTKKISKQLVRYLYGTDIELFDILEIIIHCIVLHDDDWLCNDFYSKLKPDERTPITEFRNKKKNPKDTTDTKPFQFPPITGFFDIPEYVKLFQENFLDHLVEESHSIILVQNDQLRIYTNKILMLFLNIDLDIMYKSCFALKNNYGFEEYHKHHHLKPDLPDLPVLPYEQIMFDVKEFYISILKGNFKKDCFYKSKLFVEKFNGILDDLMKFLQ